MPNADITLSNLGLNNTTLIAIAVVNLVLVLGLVFYVFKQNHRIAELEIAAKPKYGFLGKPLFSMFAMLLLVGGFGVTYFASQSFPDSSVSDGTKVDLELVIEPGALTTAGREVSFHVIPSIDGIRWGGAKVYKFDAYWTITGVKVYSEPDLDLTIDKTGGFKKVLPLGIYKVKVDVVYGGKTWTKTVDVNI